jgi:hydroxyacylglutathione hydrolase
MIMPKAHKRYNHLDAGCVDVDFTVLGPIQNNVYAIDDGTGVIVVDPSCMADDIMAMVGGRTVDAIFVTHNHWDHVTALAEIHRRTGAQVVAPKVDAPIIEAGQTDRSMGVVTEGCAVDRKVGDGDTVAVGDATWRVIATPGHTAGSVCYFLDAKQTAHPDRYSLLVSGDTLFCASIGRTDLPGGSLKDMQASLRRLSELPNDTIVLPGHNMLTTIAAEQQRVFKYYC